MKFSLINVAEQSGPLVSGYWVQNHVGSLASAREAARATEAANSNKIDRRRGRRALFADTSPRLLLQPCSPGRRSLGRFATASKGA